MAYGAGQLELISPSLPSLSHSPLRTTVHEGTERLGDTRLIKVQHEETSKWKQGEKVPSHRSGADLDRYRSKVGVALTSRSWLFTTSVESVYRKPVRYAEHKAQCNPVDRHSFLYVCASARLTRW